MKSLGETFFGRALGLLADAVIRYRWLFLWPQILLCVLCVLYTVRHLQFDASQDNLVSSNEKYQHTYLKFKNEFPAQDDLAVVVESENPEKNRQFVERLGAKLEVETKTFTNIIYRTDFKMLGRKALLFASEDDLKGLRDQLVNFLPFIQRFTGVTNLDALFGMVNDQFLHARNETNAQNDALIKAIPVLQRIVDQAAYSLQHPGIPPSPGIAALFGAGDEDIYITFDSNQIYLVTAQAVSDEASGEAVEEMRRLVARTEREVPGLNVGVTGESVLDHDQMEQSRKDATVASIVSLVLCSLIFIYGYQETGRPLKATFCLLVGLGYTLAFTTLTVGHLNILTVTFLPILIGLAIDFGVHLITRYEEELRHGRTEEEAIRKAMVYTGQGVFTGALTTSAAFVAMALTNFKGIQEMGVICGGGMLICFVVMMTMLPVLLFRGTQNRMDHEQALKPDLRARIESIWLQRPVPVIVATISLSLAALLMFPRIYFDYDLLNLQSKGLPAVVFAKKLIDSKAKSVLFAAVVADSPQQAVDLEKRLRALSTVADVDSMATRVMGEQVETRRMIGEIKKDIASIHFEPADMAPVNLAGLSRTLYSTAGFMGAGADAAEKDDPDVAAQLRALRDSITALRRQMWSGDEADRDEASTKLAIFQRALLNDVHDTFDALQEQDNSAPLRAADLPPSLHDRFIGVTGKFLLQVYPKYDVWQRDNQESFVKELQTVDPNATGTPVQLYYYTELLKTSYETAAWYALIAIVLMVLVHFRTFSSVVLALLPVGIGFIWLCGLMGFFHIPFNPANIMTLPLVIGIGVTNGIHILNRFAEEKNPGILAKSTGKAVFISGLATMSGFGSLILGQHQGLRSLGEVMSLGVATCMIAGLTFLPAVLTLWVPWRDPAKKQPSGDNARSTLGREEPR
jgi:hopanoid biosynthesis associated RND transporter like protein HpnN